MKRTILLLAICLVSNSCQINSSEEKSELIERQHVFNECLSAAHHHSGLIRTFREQASPDLFNPNILVNHDGIVKEIDRISLSYLDANGIEYNESEFRALSHKILFDNIKTRSDQSVQISNEFLNDLMGVLDFDNIDQIENDVSQVLFSEKYVSTSDELFNICAVTAAVFVDSALYWDENINEWIDSQTDDVSTKCLDWDYLWSLIEPIIYADAEAAVAAAYIGAWLGPLDAVVIAAAAAIASIFACMTSVAP
ncbi:MAG TPA: hypothetical protein PKY83_04655 [Bacteroidales bacterium]|jgi:hypothetical protein|nr:hypothetical protein [Bacteroidales bacterium]MCZ2416991.1 hypothetical protein [Burkholderiales bacterium]OQC56535.1 MAG: hypothetical protein BWX52_01618 [Bacteroidetes bacterium ADurb.Bin013]MBV6456795.1 hypothetical protein [Bacteroidales bacterium]MCZ2316604.1 hypothetical protein [Bacteroidales bacterium]